jgi:FixJ family two-component response regulator
LNGDATSARKRIAIAIVEDDASVRVSMRRLCDALGFMATAFASGRAFLEDLDGSAARPDCVLVDLQMPDMTGLELHRMLLARGVNVPTIVVTADDTPEVLDRCVSAGLTVRLQKPFDAELLFTTVQQAIRNVPTACGKDLRA